MDEQEKDVGYEIGKYLQDRGISKSHVALRSGIDRSRFSVMTSPPERKKNGRNKGVITLDEYVRIIKVLGVPFEQFI